jgi:hypothetical protein
MLRSFCPPLSERAGADDLSSADYTPHRAKSRVQTPRRGGKKPPYVFPRVGKY